MTNSQHSLMSGNEAMAEGAIEAGVGFCASYPGTPSTEITESLMRSASDRGIYVEWSTNEKVALEAASAASWAGIPALCPIKSLGLNVAADFLLNLNLSGSGKGGLVIVVCDDPEGHSSSNEQDSRFYAKAAMLPMLEPSSGQEAREAILHAFDLSRRHEVPVIVRSTTRLSHSSSLVSVGPLLRATPVASTSFPRGLFNVPRPAMKHRELLDKIHLVAAEFEQSTLNRLNASPDTKTLLISSGICQRYSEEALTLVDTENTGSLGLVTTNPIPSGLIEKAIARVDRVLFVEETDPFLEDEIRSLSAGLSMPGRPRFYGKRTKTLPAWGEMSVDHVVEALSAVLGVPHEKELQPAQDARVRGAKLLIPRPLTFCAGCTHRNVYWALRQEKKRRGGRLVVAGDIGCYSMGVFYDEAMNTMQAMGSGIGTACGLGQLGRFGFESAVVAVAGDSTFFHACLPALVNARHKNANLTFLILDNETTAMTGFQSHPGSATQDKGQRRISIRDLVQAVGPDYMTTSDSIEISPLVELVHTAIAKDGLKVLILKGVCRLEQQRRGVLHEDSRRVSVDPALCRGEKCKICFSQFGCTAIGWLPKEKRATILDEVCVHCASCIGVCPYKAIRRE